MRSVVAVLAGFAAMAMAVIVTTILFARLLYLDTEPGALPTPTRAWLAVNLAYSLGAAVLGGWLAVIAAAALPGILRGGAPGQPAWYPAVLAALAIGGILLGGRLSPRRLKAV